MSCKVGLHRDTEIIRVGLTSSPTDVGRTNVTVADQGCVGLLFPTGLSLSNAVPGILAIVLVIENKRPSRLSMVRREGLS